MQHTTIVFSQHGLSEFRLKKVKQKLPNNSQIKTNELYFINSSDKLNSIDVAKLENLLNGHVINNLELNQNNLLVIPRLGTVSPFSSKATEIANRCGITNINRIEKGLYFQATVPLNNIYSLIHDKMTESIITDITLLDSIFKQSSGNTYTNIDILSLGKEHLAEINKTMGLALSSDEIDYLYENYSKINRNPTDIELMMFAQTNSEHCRHKIFNANFIINGQQQEKTLFQMIKDTYKKSPQNVLVAYDDNSSVISGKSFDRFYPDTQTKQYKFNTEKTHVLMKVETHNHPTAIAPFSGAATGSGGEIRDEGATGRGAKPKAALTGFSVSKLNFIDNNVSDKPHHIKSALDIMLEGPIGGANFNNEFGRPNLCGYFRTFEQQVGQTCYGYHKPIMIAGGYGVINDNHMKKNEVVEGALIIQLGGPGFLIGLGGGSASSMSSGENLEELDFNSVQRSNPEMERRCQEVIDSCTQMGKDNPIISIHDIGAGGLSNAVPELVHGSNKGGDFNLRSIPIYDTSMSPLEIWCNESQERYVIAIFPTNLEVFSEICKRENCPFAVLGHATNKKQLILRDELFKNEPINVDIDVLLGKPPKTTKDVTFKLSTEHHDFIATDVLNSVANFDSNSVDLIEACYKVISHPSVASKSFLITIGDRSVGGFTVRDQMVGKWQIPVANCAITTFGHKEHAGEVASMGERTPIATLNAPASGRLAIAEALTNIASAEITELNDVKLSANWMASCGSENQDALLYRTVDAVSILCQELGIAIPVGKDSLSMKMQWNDGDKDKQVISPISLIISAFATTPDARNHRTPELVNNLDSSIILISLNNKNRLGASILQECYNSISGDTPDVDSPLALLCLFKLVQELHQTKQMLAYHDKSDGGLIATICEMLFTSRIGVELELETSTNINEFMFNEEIGIVLQIDNDNLANVSTLAKKYNLEFTKLGTINLKHDNLIITQNNVTILNEPRIKLQQAWSNVSHKIQSLRDNPKCADSEYENVISPKNKGLFAEFNFDANVIQTPMINVTRPKIAILREQGVNGHVEIGAAFTLAGFDAIDVHLNDLLNDRISLLNFKGLAFGGGFSYGDVLGAGTGFAKSIVFNPKLKDEFSAFFNRNDTFGIGVCNGCQTMSQLADIIPGAGNFPKLQRNISEQFEARVCMVEIMQSPSILFTDMIGAKLPIVVSHGEGYTQFKDSTAMANANITMRYIDSTGIPTEVYPFNPNGSPHGITAVTNNDGRFTIMMPHPERIFRTMIMSWHDKNWGEMSPWFKMFLNARDFVS